MASTNNLREAKIRILEDLHWNPDGGTLFALLSYLLVVGGLYTAFQVFTIENTAANFITFGPVTLVLLGIGVPVFYTVLVRKQPITDLGITVRKLIPSVILGLILAWDTYRNTLAGVDFAWSKDQIPLITMALAVGLFEAVFFRGWLQLRFEKAFGLVPGLILAALCYSFYHVGYGMTGGEMLFLFGLGLTFGGFFRLTKNVFLLWPFYTPIGSIYSNFMDGLALPFEATYGFLLTIGLMLALLITAAVWSKKNDESKGF